MFKFKNDVYYKGKEKGRFLYRDLWDGDPDIDAICRLSHMLVVNNIDKPFASDNLSPFNSQIHFC